MAVEARMRCMENRAVFMSNDPTQPEYRAVTLQALYDDGPENKVWSKYTPVGDVHMTITNPDAFEQFESGETYSIKFERVARTAAEG